NTLISTGSLARSAVVARIYEKHSPDFDDEDLLRAKVSQEVQSISMITHKDSFLRQLGSEAFKDFYALTFEAYSGGYIESPRYGFTDTAFTADITSAYPATIK